LRVSIGKAAPEDLPDVLKRARAGISFIKPCTSKLASSPTKVAEYLAAGLPVLSTAGIGDTDAVLRGVDASTGGPVGVIVGDLCETGYEAAARELLGLLGEPETPRRCRDVARHQFDLESVGWARYRSLYAEVLSRGPHPIDVWGPSRSESS